jgi:peptidoglycan/LPS O-acetylase OafA/YrhL
MFRISIFFGLLLVSLGLGYYVVTTFNDNPQMTALIPVIPGAIIGVCGMISLFPKLRKHAAHAAALIGLLGFLAGLGRGVMTLGKEDSSLLALSEQFLMAVICLVYLVFCVRSFISARKAMKAEAGALSPESEDARPAAQPEDPPTAEN